MSRLNVLVVGASIAGPTTAYWLAKAGANVTIIERFPSLRQNGQNIDIRNVGVTVMRKMKGMEAAVKARLAPIDGFSWVDASGKPFGTMTPSGDPNEQTLVSEYEIYRGELSNILYEMTRSNERIKYVFGEQVASIQQNNNGPVTVEFANGLLPVSTFDLIVACDGATSRTRALGFECGVRDHITPMNSWGAYFTIDGDLLNGGRLGESFNTPGGRFLAIGPRPSGKTTQGLLMAINPQNGPDFSTPFRQASKQGDEALKRHVYQHFQGAGWKTDEILKGMMEAEDFYASEFVQVKLPRLSKGRFVAVGDAGYGSSFTGTGTSLALAGAYMLAGAVCQHKDDLGMALQRYEERMKPLLDDMQKSPPGVREMMAPQTAWGLWLRNTIIAWVTWSGVLKWGGKFFASSFSEDKYNLPDYDWES
ncbi:FAD/NAD(P)-binding domain-containing protein [Aaosphaeria arxii CBS 175.79]|uniref:FAD/NAD(P)-binding domain-containing protein n=1 Tax=Aaosphaeria arxii CBS 175.79 TaxID=1450172 RepID=A0A6A5Y0R3_9PLEO|nr:FAD/NAD(P)-binding domain-containing protein [Aaosphaeria arxii CBS 175.79]KAF2018144.1 FAD/NAD(P)-binding domain-containing protein [Aaosphaeria arxii CBS 175.79]